MHNKAELTFTVIKVPLDYIMLVLAGALAYSLRFEETITEIKPILFDLPFIILACLCKRLMSQFIKRLRFLHRCAY